MKVTIKNLLTMKQNSGALWSDGFVSYFENNKYVIKTRGYLTSQSTDSNLTGLTGIGGWTKRVESGTQYVYAIDLSGKVWKCNSIKRFNSSDVTNPISLSTATPSNYPDIYRLDNDDLIITAGDYLVHWDGTTLNETFGDFTSGLDSSYSGNNIQRPIIPFEDIVFIGNRDYLAKVGQDATGFDAAYKQLPEKYEVRCGAQNQSLVLFGANKHNKGMLLLWNTTDSGWTNKIPLDNEIYAIKPFLNGWLYVSGGAIYYTNGRSIKIMSYFPDGSYTTDLGLRFNDLLVIDDKVIFGGGSDIIARPKSGLWVYDTTYKEWNFKSVDTKNLRTNTFYSIYYDSYLDNILVSYYSYSNSTGTDYSVSSFYANSIEDSDTFHYITEKIVFSSDATIKNIKVRFSPDIGYTSYYSDKTLDITAAVCNANDTVWRYANARADSTNTNEIEIDGTQSGYNYANVGDMILMLDGANAGESSFISSIANQGTATEKWTLEDNLSNLTKTDDQLNVIPFKKLATKTLTNTKEVTFYNNNSVSIGNAVYVLLKVKTTHFPITIEEIEIEYEPTK